MSMERVIVCFSGYSGGELYPYEVEDVEAFKLEVQDTYEAFAPLLDAWRKTWDEGSIPQMVVRGIEFFGHPTKCPQVVTWEEWLRQARQP
jgi:hypothetical protein